MNVPAKQQKNIQSGFVPSCTAIQVPKTTKTAEENQSHSKNTKCVCVQRSLPETNLTKGPREGETV